MDWKNLKDNATIWTTKATEIAKKWFETSKEYAEKTGVWSYDKLKESKFTLKNIQDYEALKEEKRYVIFCIRDNDAFTKSFLLLLPIVFTKVWIESWSLRIIIEEGSEVLREHLQIRSIPTAILKTNDGVIKSITSEDEIRALMKNFTFYSPVDNS
jgi:hypothetical protein